MTFISGNIEVYLGVMPTLSADSNKRKATSVAEALSGRERVR